METSSTLVLVTGGSGFIAGHCIVRLLERGYRVRTTIRSLDREEALRAQLARLGAADTSALEVVVADLTSDAGWTDAAAGVHAVLHVASPVPHGAPQSDDEVIRPAREGTLRVLRGARDAGVPRVVLTSAFHAIGFGWGRTDHVFTDDDWSKLDGPGIDAYGRSKVFAERAAWDFVRSEGRGMELVALNPVAVLGPLAGSAPSGGNAIVQRILSGQLSAYPNLWIPIVDVRDVATAHVLAMETPDAAGQRFLITSGSGLTLKQIGGIIRANLGTRAAKVATRSIPSFVVRITSWFRPELRWVAADLGNVKKIDGSKARRVLGFDPRPVEQTVVDTAESLAAAS
jgi:nucleoside-diphosphate-sugar epimerase